MPLPEADAHLAAQRRLSAATLAAVEREWATVGEDFERGWLRVGPRMVALVTTGQLGAARDGIAYVPTALAAQSIDVAALARIEASAFAGISYSLDGMRAGSLDALLYGAVVHARSGGESLGERLVRGRTFLRTVVPGQVADANRMATGVAVTARPGVGYTRLATAPCCQRCAVLAGRFYRVASFQRHPRDDCRMVPTNEANHQDAGYTIGPDDVTDLTPPQRQAIADGADMTRVINAHRTYGTAGDYRSARTSDGMLTTAFGSHPVLTPEAIYRVTATREDALALLRKNGYLSAL